MGLMDQPPLSGAELEREISTGQLSHSDVDSSPVATKHVADNTLSQRKNALPYSATQLEEHFSAAAASIDEGQLPNNVQLKRDTRGKKRGSRVQKFYQEASSRLNRPSWFATSKDAKRVSSLTARKHTLTSMVLLDEKKAKYVLKPGTLFIDWIWEPLRTILAVYAVSLLPIMVAFDDSKELGFETPGAKAVILCIDILFGVDVILSFFIAYYDSDHHLVTQHRLIAKHYLQGFFLIDLVAAFPFDLVLPSDTGPAGVGLETDNIQSNQVTPPMLLD